MTGKLLLATLVYALGPTISAAAPVELTQFISKHYRVRTDLTRAEARVYGKHMDTVFAAFHKRFSHWQPRHSDPMSLYLFRTQDGFLNFMARQGIRAQNTSGLFFVKGSLRGLATWTRGKSQAANLAVLQHEGFHQFAHQYFGQGLPVWANEGLAQYFEDGILVDRKLTLGIANGRRIALVRRALEFGTTIPFDELLSMRSEQWSRSVTSGDARSNLLYAQSWSIIYFLVHGDQGKYRRAFDRYLGQVAAGRSSDRAFAMAFQIRSTVPFEKKWQRYALDMEPDSLHTALQRLGFLGEGLLLLRNQQAPRPENIHALRDALQTIHFRTIRARHGMEFKIDSRNESVYGYQTANKNPAKFQLLEPAGFDQPPRIAAPGLTPEPTLVWFRNTEGQLVYGFTFR